MRVNIREAAIVCSPDTMMHSLRAWPALVDDPSPFHRTAPCPHPCRPPTSLHPPYTHASPHLAIPPPSASTHTFSLASPPTYLQPGQDTIGVCIGILLQCEQAGLCQSLGPLLQGGEEEEEGGEGEGVGITLSVNRQVSASRLAPSCKVGRGRSQGGPCQA